MLTIQNYVRAESLEQAYTLNQNRRSRILGGMLWLKLSDLSVSTAIDLGGLGLDTIEETEDAFLIGAMASLRQLELHAGLNAYTQGAVARAVRDIVGVQFRNMATAGGSIFGRFGFSDVLTVFLAMDTSVELYKGGVLPLEEFARQKPDRDILVRLIVKKRPGRFVYQAVRNSRTDLPVLTCAAGRMENDEFRLAVGARPARAMLLRDEAGLLSDGMTPDAAKAFADYAAEHIPTGSNLRGSAEYRSHLIRVLARRSIMELGGMQDGNQADLER